MPSSPMPPVSIEQPPSELTIHLDNPPHHLQSIEHSATETLPNVNPKAHLQAFLANFAQPTLITNFLFVVLIHYIIAALIRQLGIYLEWTYAQVTIPNILMVSIPFVTVPRYLYEALMLPTDYAITLSLSTQQMTVTRLGYVRPSFTIPLNEVLSFSYRKDEPGRNSKDHNYIIAYTTGEPIKLGVSRKSYITAVSHLNQYLLHHRTNNATAIPYTPLRCHYLETFRAERVMHERCQLPTQSCLKFREIGNRSFKCVELDSYPIESIVRGIPGVYLQKFRFLSVFHNDLHRQPLYESLWLLFYAVFGVCFIRLTPTQWICYDGEEQISRIRRFLNRLFHVHYIPVRLYNKISISASTFCREEDLRSRVLKEKVIPMETYEMSFCSDSGDCQKIEGFSEGEMVCLVDWLQRGFPRLFDGDLVQDELDRGQDDVKSLEEKKKQ